MNATEHLERKQLLQNATGKISNGTMYVLHNGQWITDKAFRAIYLLPIKIGRCSENPDKRNLYL
jgi:hypothetical protein